MVPVTPPPNTVIAADDCAGSGPKTRELPTYQGAYALISPQEPGIQAKPPENSGNITLSGLRGFDTNGRAQQHQLRSYLWMKAF